MSSSYKQKKMKTLATRKKTRKRRMLLGLGPEDDSGRLFQPPSARDPRWKKPSADAIVAGIARSSKKQKVEQRGDSGGDGDGDGAEIEIVSRDRASSDQEEQDAEQEAERAADSDEEPAQADLPALPKTPLRLCSSLEDVVAKAAAQHAAIRRKDGRQKAKVLLLVDARSIYKALKKKMNIRQEMVKPKSRLGIGSAKKPELAFRNTGLVKTPLDRFKDANKDVLAGFRSGKLSTILAEDTTFFPYAGMRVQHVVFVAKHAASVLRLDRTLLRDVALHSFVMDDKSAGAAAVSDEQRQALDTAFLVRA